MGPKGVASFPRTTANAGFGMHGSVFALGLR